MPSSADPQARQWLGLCGALAAGALVGWVVPAPWLDWQPARALADPWRWWTAAFVHWSPLHLAANLGALALVAALGRAAAAPGAVAGGWLLAWPATHLALLAEPTLAHYGGLSGVLHAGVGSLAVWLLWACRGRRRLVGAALAIGLVLKTVSEAPWVAPLAHPPGWDVAVAPLAHAAGALAGVSCTLASLAWRRRRP